jgi:subtilisin family serine protease
MKNSKKFALYLLCLTAVVLAAAVQGFGQTKFYTTANPIPNKYIVVLNKDLYNDESKLAVSDAAQDLASTYNGQVDLIYESALKGFSVEMSEEDAIALSDDSQVEYVTEDNTMYASDTQTNAPWNLDRIDQRDRPLNTTYTYSANGTGVGAYILDTGIYRLHSEFGGLTNSRVGLGPDFVGGNGADCNGHGTHVAGTVGGATYGVAKNVFIISVRVLGCDGSGSTSGIVGGIDWVRANHGTKAVANLSLGGPVNQALDDAVRNLINSGVITVVAAGNENADALTKSPARVKQAITVGASDINDARASFSNFGNAVDVFAPGVNVTSAWLNNGFNTISGTSMAAPHVTGVVAQYLQNSFNPTQKTVQDVLITNGSWLKIANPGSQSPNIFLYSASFNYGDTLKPFLRYWYAAGTDHFYTNSWDEIGAGNGQWQISAVDGYFYTTQISGTIPLYRYWNSSTVDHFYTTNFNELGNGGGGYVYDRIIGYVYSSQPTGGLPLYRYWSPTLTNHFYTTNFSELGYGGGTYTYDGIPGYLVQYSIKRLVRECAHSRTNF